MGASDSGHADGQGQGDGQGDGEGTRIKSLAEQDARINGIESKLDTLLDKLGAGETKVHEGARQREEQRLDRPTSIADEIRSQFAERDRAQAAADADTARENRLAGLETKLSELTETKPDAPVRRIEKVMGWH